MQADSATRLQRDEDAATWAALALGLAALAVILVIALAQVWLSRRTRRWLNPGLVAALALIILATGAGGWLVVTGQQHLRRIAAGPQQVTERLVEARLAAFEARAVESAAIIGQQVPAAEADWAHDLADAEQALAEAKSLALLSSPDLVPDISSASAMLRGQYAAAHARLLAAASAGDFTRAAAIATSPTVEGSTGAFEDFDAVTGAVLARQVQATDDAWQRIAAALVPAAWLTFACGAAAAAAGWWGMARRIREYL